MRKAIEATWMRLVPQQERTMPGGGTETIAQHWELAHVSSLPDLVNRCDRRPLRRRR